jgi:hypothetical protein
MTHPPANDSRSAQRPAGVRAASLPIGAVDFGRLIEALGPLNNGWRAADGVAKVLVLWEIGDALLAAAPKANDATLWEVQRRSYITRTVMRYALIVRRAWPQRSALTDLLQGVRSYAVFREALPFLKGDREGIDDATHARVLDAIRQPDVANATAMLRALKREKIGRVHTKRLKQLLAGQGAGNFLDAFVCLVEATKRGEVRPVAGSALAATRTASQLAMALAEGTDRVPNMVTLEAEDPVIGSVLAALAPLGGANRESRNAFRSTVGAPRLMEAAELLNALRDAESLEGWRRRRR